MLSSLAGRRGRLHRRPTLQAEQYRRRAVPEERDYVKPLMPYLALEARAAKCLPFIRLTSVDTTGNLHRVGVSLFVFSMFGTLRSLRELPSRDSSIMREDAVAGGVGER